MVRLIPITVAVIPDIKNIEHIIDGKPVLIDEEDEKFDIILNFKSQIWINEVLIGFKACEELWLYCAPGGAWVRFENKLKF